MANQEQQIPNAPFPAPPPFWKHFTTENLSRLKALKESNTNTNTQDIPPGLSYLEPPTPPSENYTVFGEEQTLSTTLPPLSQLGIPQLYPSTPTNQNHHAASLLQIVRSLHLNFQELSVILSLNPTLIGPKLEDIKNLFQNAHWLINMYRPHQARESLIAIMEEQIEEGRREMQECERVKNKVEERLEEIEREGHAIERRDGDGGNGKMTDIMRNGTSTVHAMGEDEHAKRLWRMMTDIEIEAD